MQLIKRRLLNCSVNLLGQHKVLFRAQDDD